MQGENSHMITSPRIHTTHGYKKNQGMLAVVNDKTSLCYTEGKDNHIIAYTTLDEIIAASSTLDLPRVTVSF